jgi:hypothetical protein
VQGAEVIDIWTGNVIDVPVGQQNDTQDTERQVAEAIDGLAEIFCGPLKPERILQLDRVTMRDDSYFDFVLQSLHRSQTSGDEYNIFKLCESEVLEFPKFIMALSHIFGAI